MKIKFAAIVILVTSILSVCVAQKTLDSDRYGPAAALRFAMRYRGDTCIPGAQNCYPDAIGIPFSETEHFIPMDAHLWRPEDIAADFRKRVVSLPPDGRKLGIIVVLKTERCATKELRACSVTTAALDKLSTPLVDRFLIYGLQLKPRDHDKPPGSLRIEVEPDEWKNEAAGTYMFRQGPGATIVFLNPINGAMLRITNAVEAHLTEKEFAAREGRTPELEEMLKEILSKIEYQKTS